LLLRGDFGGEKGGAVISLVLPKGSLEPGTLRLFEDADLPVRRISDRDYGATIADPRIGKVKILRPQEIGLAVQDGYFDLGITGLDWIRETGAEVEEVMDLGPGGRDVGGFVRIVLAVPQTTHGDLPEHLPPRTRISTEYPNLTRQYFERLGIPVTVSLSYGATEAKIPELADAIVELTETGSSLRRAGLKVLGVVLESSTKLIANVEAWADPEKRREIEDITTLLRGVLSARGKVLLKLNVHESNLQRVIEVLPAMKSPTVSHLFGSDYYAVETVAVKSEINLLIPELKKRGAEDILEIPMSKIVA
jgi:ATP phosphoribosyltransferase